MNKIVDINKTEDLNRIKNISNKIRLNGENIGVYVSWKEGSCCGGKHKWKIHVIISKSDKENSFKQILVDDLTCQRIIYVEKENVLYNLYNEIYNGRKLN